MDQVVVSLTNKKLILLFTVVSCWVHAVYGNRTVINIVVMESAEALANETTYIVYFLKPLLELAAEKGRTAYGDVMDIHYKLVETYPGPSRIGALAAKVYYTDSVSVFFGPVSNEGVITLAYMALSWNTPVITPRGNDPLSRNSTTFPNLITLHPYDKLDLVKFTKTLCDRYGWRHVSLLTDTDRSVMKSTGDVYQTYFKEPMVLKSFSISGKSFTYNNWVNTLLQSSATSRVFVLLMDVAVVRQCLLIASAQGMTSREYLYIVPDIDGVLISGDPKIWQMNDSDDEAAKKAFQTVMIINILKPLRSDFSGLLLRLNEKMFGANISKYVASAYDDEDESTNSTYHLAQQYVLTGYYNAFLIYLAAVNETLASGGDITNGSAMVDRMCNKTYYGGAGYFQIDSEGRRVINFSISDMTDEETGVFQTVGLYADFAKIFLPESGYSDRWPAGDNYVVDVPSCGFKRELCLSSSSELTVAISCGLVALAVIVCIGLTVILRLRYVNQARDLFWWRIHPDELQPYKNAMTKSSLYSGFLHSTTNATESSVTSQSVYLYKGNVIRANLLCETNVHVNHSLLMEFDVIRDVSHPNLLRVLGAWLEGERKMIITEHCPKGSLQEILMDSKYTLDSIFMFSILSDLVKALAYIHKRPMKVHGRLTSEVCFIDSRFSVKVGFYGLPTVYDHIKLLNKKQSLEKDLLWMAPELLRHGGSPTQQADIYSLAIIISEMLTREEPYCSDKDYLTTKEVVERIKRGQDPPLRPIVHAPEPDLVTMETLMRKCWSEDPEKRPSLHYITSVVNRLMVKINKSGGLVDNLLQRLEKYSSNLEKIVDEKVDELRQEKQKSEELLRQMLPISVADRLKAGLSVEPEFYDCVTIYFSDIVGFTVICSELSPVQIINLLNDLYSSFDEIIGNYDVYKVETIGDAYMVVSGLPTRNGDEHARQIARMSLTLLSCVSNFTFLSTTDNKLKLRIGLNSGPVCAGVVGLKMPRYCLFGDTVNTASRMESNGLALRIHMSASTANILRKLNTFSIESRGYVDIKGKGIMETFWLTGEKV